MERTVINIEAALKKALLEYAEQARIDNYQSDRTWTRKLMEKLGRLGEEEFNCSVRVSGFSKKYLGEWLFDMIWYVEEGEHANARFVDLPLVVECEWNRNFLELKSDFEKLLVVNATLRLFVCYIYPGELQIAKDYFIDAIRKYKLGATGDRFFIALLKAENKEFEFLALHRNYGHD